MTFGQPSGTTSFNPILSDMAIDAWERVDSTKFAAAKLTTDHMLSARMSANLVNVRFAVRGVNLWKVDNTPTLINLIQGVSTYPLPSDVVGMLDTYIRQFQIGAANNQAPSFQTTLNSTSVTVNQVNSGALFGQFVSIPIPVSIGGLILQGFYTVASVLGANQYTITAASPATSNAGPGGTVPAFTTIGNSATLSVNLPNHGYVAGQTFAVQVNTLVGGYNLLGNYAIAGITDANNFTITMPNPAGFSQTVSENNGQCQIGNQNQSTDPTDILLYGLSRNDYAAIPDKFVQGRPTTMWFNRQISPSVTIWPTPDNNGPYQMQTYLLHQVQDAVLSGGTTANLPFRFQAAYIAALAADLAVKWAPDKLAMLKTEAAETWQEASDDDREKVSFYLMPDLSGYGL